MLVHHSGVVVHHIRPESTTVGKTLTLAGTGQTWNALVVHHSRLWLGLGAVRQDGMGPAGTVMAVIVHTEA